MQWKNLVVGVKQLFDLLLKVGEIAVLLPDLHLCLLQRLQQVFYHSLLLLRRHLQLLELLCSSSFRLQLSARKGGKDRADGMCIVPTGQMCAWVRNCCLTQAVSKTALLQTASGAWLQGCSFKSTLADDSFLVNISRISSASFFKSSFISSFNFVLFCAAGASWQISMMLKAVLVWASHPDPRLSAT